LVQPTFVQAQMAPQANFFPLDCLTTPLLYLNQLDAPCNEDLRPPLTPQCLSRNKLVVGLQESQRRVDGADLAGASGLTTGNSKELAERLQSCLGGKYDFGPAVNLPDLHFVHPETLQRNKTQ
jgi:hypothetical protein